MQIKVSINSLQEDIKIQITLECTKDFIDTEDNERIWSSGIFYTFTKRIDDMMWKGTGDLGDKVLVREDTLEEYFDYAS